jgi:hypothetical protein
MNHKSKRRVVVALAAPFALAMTTGTMSACASDGTGETADTRRTQSSETEAHHTSDQLDAEDGKAKGRVTERQSSRRAEKREESEADDATSTGSTITLSGSLVESTKDIVYVEFFSGGTSVKKRQDIDSKTFDLRTVTGIDYDRIEVKSATTIESFALTGSADPAVAPTPTPTPTSQPAARPAVTRTFGPSPAPAARPQMRASASGRIPDRRTRATGRRVRRAP